MSVVTRRVAERESGRGRGCSEHGRGERRMESTREERVGNSSRQAVSEPECDQIAREPSNEPGTNERERRAECEVE
jgi:hypothetical protein